MDSDPQIAQSRLAAIVESSHDAILAKDTNGVVTEWNPAAERLYGYRPDEIVGRSIDLLIPPEHAGESEFILAEVLAGRSVAPYDTERVTKAGRRVSVSIAVSPIHDPSGMVVGASTIARDIGERLAADADRAWTAMLVSQSADAIVALDESGRISTWNPAAASMFGFTVDEARGRLPHEVVRSSEPEAQVQLVDDVLGSGQTRRYEARRLHRDGHELIVEISVAPLAIVPGRHAGAVVSIRDVTAARAAALEIERAQERETKLVQELEQTRRLESVGQLAGGIAHDFNNLLNVIINLAMLAADDVPEGTIMREDLDEIVNAGQRAASLTRRLLIFSRRDIARVEVVDLGEIIHGLEGFLRRALGEQITIEVEVHSELWPIEIDRGQAEQVLVNLAVNARDAMKSGGRLIIEARNTTVDAEFAGTRVGLAPGNYVTLTVSDTGEGMDPGTVERAFDPFFTTKAKGEGTGLGLATVYGIVSQAGGRVAIYSERGRGTSVNSHLPASRKPLAPRRRDGGAAPRGRGERVLVVEDADDVRRITARILSAAGYEVLTAGTGAEAIELVESAPAIDLVLTDVIMPAMTGLELVQTLRRDHPGLPVVFMSGYSGKMLLPDLLEHEGAMFIGKPFTSDQVQSKIAEALRPEH